jgi:two-component system KDP operon response regulator KdpE
MDAFRPVAAIISSDAHVRQFVRAGFELGGFDVCDLSQDSNCLSNREVDLIVIDTERDDPLRLLKRARESTLAPVIVLFAGREIGSQIRSLDELGAEDYLRKPFAMTELLTRARVTVARGGTLVASNLIQAGGVTIDLTTQSVPVDGSHLELTHMEYALMRLLASRAGNVVTFNRLLKELRWEPSTRRIHDLISLLNSLRRKVERLPTQPSILLAELGIGYRLADEHPARG